jgi:small redox-active disulfide protein 2
MDIKVLGPGCKKCQETEKIVREAVVETSMDAQVGKVTNVMEIAKFGVFGTPAVIIDGEIQCVGKVPSKEDVLGWLKAKQNI